MTANSFSPLWAVALTGTAVGGDLAKVRPLAVHRQVPQWWGHRYGPFAAAARYGLRMGVGPATLLNTWLWWAGFALGAMSGPAWAMASGAGFALSRVLSMNFAVVGVRDGTTMAKRMASIVRRRHHIRRLGHVISLAVAGAAATTAVLG